MEAGLLLRFSSRLGLKMGILFRLGIHICQWLSFRREEVRKEMIGFSLS